MKERIYKTMIMRYQHEMEDAFLKIDMLLAGNSTPVLVDHVDLTGAVHKLLEKVATAKGNMAILRQYYGTN